MLGGRFARRKIMEDKIGKVKKYLGIIKDSTTIISTILAVIIGFKALSEWKQSVINPVRNEIVKRQTEHISENLDFLISKNKTTVCGDTLDLAVLYYINEITESSYFNTKTILGFYLNNYLNNINDGKHISCQLESKIITVKGRQININTIFISENMDLYLKFLDGIKEDPYLSKEIQRKAESAQRKIFDYQLKVIPEIVEEIITDDLTKSEYKPENIINTIGNKSWKYEKAINEDIYSLREEFIKLLRIDELYNVS
jgi:hypothetical protein